MIEKPQGILSLLRLFVFTFFAGADAWLRDIVKLVVQLNNIIKTESENV